MRRRMGKTTWKLVMVGLVLVAGFVLRGTYEQIIYPSKPVEPSASPSPNSNASASPKPKPPLKSRNLFASGGPTNGQVPLMADGGCPAEFPAKRNGLCHE